MKVAVIQLNSSSDKADNLERVAKLISECAANSAQLIALPEVFNLRTKTKESIEAAEAIPDGESTQILSELASKHQVWILNGSIFERAEPLPYNSSVLINPQGQVAAKYRKIHLFDMQTDEKTILESNKSQAGNKPCLSQVEDWSIGISICYDLRFSELYRHYADQAAELIAVPSAFTKMTGKDHWHTLLKARAIENQAYVIAPNQCCSGSGFEAYGHSMIIDPWGKILAEASADQEEIIYADLDKTVLNKIRKNLPALKHRRL